MSKEPESQKPPGLVCTFYSFKGGVGRSMALSNVGVVMAAEGHRVLLVDWDLEAPGLDVCFRNAARLVGDPSATPGVVDLLEAHAAGRALSWRQCLLRAEFLDHSLEVISAGKRDGDYRERVQGLKWDSLYRDHRVGNFINRLRDEWRDEYDFVLIDSRTGITDIGDVCTVLLPDVLVLMFVTNYQNVEGVKTIMERAVRARAKLRLHRSKLLGVPVPARDERDREYEKSREWQGIYAQEFGYLYREWLPKEIKPSDALNRLFIPYVASWSFGERIPVIENERERSDPTSLGAAYRRLATLLAHRLDWYAIEGRVSTDEVVGTRLELAAVRTRAREAELEAEKAQQLVRRTRLRARGLVLGSLALLGIVAFVGYQWFRDRAPAKAASAALAVSQTPTELFTGDDLRSSGDTTGALRVYEARRLLLDTQLAAKPDDLDTKRDLVATLRRIGDTRMALADLDEALAAYRSAADFIDRQLKNDPRSSDWQRESALTGLELASIARVEGRLDEAMSLLVASAKIFDTLVSKDPDNRDWQLDVFIARDEVGSLLEARGEFRESLASYEAARDLAAKQSAIDPEDARWMLATSRNDIALAEARHVRGELKRAMEAYDTSRELFDRLAEVATDNVAMKYAGARLRVQKAVALQAEGRWDESLTTATEGLKTVQALAEKDPENADWQVALAICRNVVGRAYEGQGKHPEALASFERGRALIEKVVAREPAHANWQRDRSVSWKSIGRVSMAMGRTTEALRALRTAELGLLRASPTATAARDALEIKAYLIEGAIISGDLIAARSACVAGKKLLGEIKIDEDGAHFWQPQMAAVERACGEAAAARGDTVVAIRELSRARRRLADLPMETVGNVKAREEIEKRLAELTTMRAVEGESPASTPAIGASAGEEPAVSATPPPEQ